MHWFLQSPTPNVFSSLHVFFPSYLCSFVCWFYFLIFFSGSLFLTSSPFLSISFQPSLFTFLFPIPPFLPPLRPVPFPPSLSAAHHHNPMSLHSHATLHNKCPVSNHNVNFSFFRIKNCAFKWSVMSWKVNLLYFPSESFGALVCCNRRRFEETFDTFGKKKKEKRKKNKKKKKRCERGQGRLLHPSNVTRRLDLGLKILSSPRQSFMLHARSFSFQIPPQKSPLSFVLSQLFVSYSALETQNGSFLSTKLIIAGISQDRSGFDPRAVNVKLWRTKWHWGRFFSRCFHIAH